MRFVAIKTEAQQAALMLHKSRALLVRQQTMLVNAMRAHMAELGLIAPQGRARINNLIAVIEDDEEDSIPVLAKAALKPLVLQLRAGEAAISSLDAEIKSYARKLVTAISGGVFDLLDAVLEFHSLDELGELA